MNLNLINGSRTKQLVSILVVVLFYGYFIYISLWWIYPQQYSQSHDISQTAYTFKSQNYSHESNQTAYIQTFANQTILVNNTNREIRHSQHTRKYNDFVKRSNFSKFNKLMVECQRKENEFFSNANITCMIQNPYYRIINAFISHDLHNKRRHSFANCDEADYINRKIVSWRKSLQNSDKNYLKTYPQLITNRNNINCTIIPQSHFIYDICDNISISHTETISLNNTNCKWSMTHLNWGSLDYIKNIYADDFKAFKFAKYIYPINQSERKQKTWDRVKHLHNLYTIPDFDYKPLSPSNVSNICKMNSLKSDNMTTADGYVTAAKTSMDKNIQQNITIGLCTKVRNELPHLFEWIEYYRTFQKVDKLYIYNDASQDRTKYLRYFYSKYMWNYTQVDIIPMIPHKGGMHKMCRERALKDNITWLGVVDMDEFMYAKRFKTIKDFIHHIHFTKPQIKQIFVTLRAFGSTIKQTKFKYDLNINISVPHCVNFNASISLQTLNDCDVRMINANDDGIVTVIGEHLYRKGANEDTPAECGLYQQQSGAGSVCSAASFNKAIWKTTECLEPGTHKCRKLKASSSRNNYQNITEIRGNHYFLTRYENIFANYNWNKPQKKVMLVNEAINPFFRSVYEPYLADKYHHALSQRLGELLRCRKSSELHP